MGFFDDNAGGSGPPLLKFDGKAGQFLQKCSDTPAFRAADRLRGNSGSQPLN